MASSVSSTPPPPQQQLHVVAVPVAAQGHINPMMRFCKVLASAGIRVTFVNVDPIHHRLEQLNQQEGDADADDDEEAKRHEQQQDNTTTAVVAPDEGALNNIRRAHVPIEGLDLATDFRISFEHFLVAQNSIAPHLEGLIHKLNQEGPPVTCIFSDFSMTLPTQKVADKLSIPRIIFFTSSASCLLFMFYVLQGDRVSTKQVIEVLSQRRLKREVVFCDGLEGLPTLHNADLPYCKHVVGGNVADDTDFLWKFWTEVWQECSSRAQAIVINSFQVLEPSAFKALKDSFSLPVYGVGPLIEPPQEGCTTSLWKEDDACLLWLDQQPALSVLYISFGSLTLLSQLQFQEILDGLLASQQRFLWAFRPDLVENVSYPTFRLDVLSKFHGKGFVVDWAPQLQVLAHPAVGGFLTHCGWNSTTEAIAHGVPMLCWPYITDQFLDAKFIVDEWKVGFGFATTSGGEEEDGCFVEKNEIERVVRALMEGMEGEVLRQNIMHLKEASHRTLLPGGSSYKDTMDVMEKLLTSRILIVACPGRRGTFIVLLLSFNH